MSPMLRVLSSISLALLSTSAEADLNKCRIAFDNQQAVIKAMRDGETIDTALRMTPEMMTTAMQTQAVLQISQDLGYRYGQITEVNSNEAIMTTADGPLKVRLGEYGGLLLRSESLSAHINRLNSLKDKLPMQTRDLVSYAQAASQARALVQIQKRSRHYKRLTYIGYINSIDVIKPKGFAFEHPEELALYMSVERMTSETLDEIGKPTNIVKSLSEDEHLVLGSTKYPSKTSFRFRPEEFDSLEILATVPEKPVSFIERLFGKR